MHEHEACPRCGAPRIPDAPEGLCPRCLIAQGLATDSQSDAGAPLSDALTLSAPTTAQAGTTFRAGQQIGGHRLVQRLGHGGFGEVWETESLETGRRTALKLLLRARDASGAAIERFEREGRLAASLNHPRCVFVFGAERLEGYPAIDMELMPGGTLQDVLRRDGRLPYARAVDYVIDVISGLEAAYAAGILHRDVKPSNCFVDSDGRVKVGDFGLSKSLEDASLVSNAGGFIGTPSFASPEQVRGLEMDVRSDIYSVGATLYALLAGAPPFRGPTAVETLARILTDQPPPLRDSGARVPAALERIVRRTLSKNATARPRTYDTLRSALRPFSSGALIPGGLRRRVAAYSLDVLPFTLASVAFQIHGAFATGLGPWSRAGLATLAAFFYFGLTEGLWGQSLGKRLLNLRVTGTDGKPAGLVRAFARAAVLIGLGQIASLPVFFSASPVVTSPLLGLGMFATSYLFLITMRRSNGYAGLHEVWSGTRVIADVRPNAVRVPDLSPPTAGVPAPRSTSFGPYAESHAIWQTPGEGLSLGWDPVLRRSVWVHWFTPRADAPPPTRLAVAHPYRLRWLQGSRAGNTHWDAYEAPRGTSLLAWVQARGRLSWGELCGVLRGLANAISGLRDEPAPRPALSVYRIWIDDHGSPKSLDFPMEMGERPAVPIEEWPLFFLDLVHFALTGQLGATPVRAVPPVPLPASARTVLERLRGQAPPFGSPAELSAALAPVVTRPATVSRSQRLPTLFAIGALPIILLAMLPLSRLVAQSMEPAFSIHFYHVQAVGEADASRLEAWKVLTAATAPNVTPFQRLVLDEKQMSWVQAASREHPEVTQAQVDEARRKLGQKRRSLVPRLRLRLVWVDLVRMCVFQLTVIGMMALPLAVAFRGGVWLRSAGIVVQRADGTPARRGRCLLRTLMAFLPIWTVLLWSYLPRALHPPSGALEVLALLGMASGAAYALWHPQRGLQDRVAGTHLVPK